MKCFLLDGSSLNRRYYIEKEEKVAGEGAVMVWSIWVAKSWSKRVSAPEISAYL